MVDQRKEFIGDGILTSNEPMHAHQRSAMQPSFHRQKMLGVSDLVVKYAADCVLRWRPGSVVNVSRAMGRLTLATVGKAFFNNDLADVADDLIDAFVACQRFMTGRTTSLPDQFPTPSSFRYRSAAKRIDEIIYDLINTRKNSPQQYNDLLSNLLSARGMDGAPMNDQLIRDELVTTLWAGHETTYNALEWTWYLLSQHPHVEARFADELHRILEGRLPTAEDLPNLKYTEMVFAEAMRLYPPVWALARWAMEDDVLESGLRIRKNTQVFIMPYVLHRNPKFYPDPDCFEPERFSPENRANRPTFAYLPFSAGGRACIGEHFARMEGILVLATIAQAYRLQLVPGQKIVPEPLLTLRLKHDLMMRVESR